MSQRAEQITGSLLTIGDEILLGDIANGNAHHIASELRSRGLRLGKMVTVGDREEEIIEVLSQCMEKSHFIIVTGGLGPTDDDRTCEAVSRPSIAPWSRMPGTRHGCDSVWPSAGGLGRRTWPGWRVYPREQ